MHWTDVTLPALPVKRSEHDVQPCLAIWAWRRSRGGERWGRRGWWCHPGGESARGHWGDPL